MIMPLLIYGNPALLSQISTQMNFSSQTPFAMRSTITYNNFLKFFSKYHQEENLSLDKDGSLVLKITQLKKTRTTVAFMLQTFLQQTKIAIHVK